MGAKRVYTRTHREARKRIPVRQESAQRLLLAKVIFVLGSGGGSRTTTLEWVPEKAFSQLTSCGSHANLRGGYIPP
jgi:hypothetical protein